SGGACPVGRRRHPPPVGDQQRGNPYTERKAQGIVEILCADRPGCLGSRRARQERSRSLYRYRMISSTFFFLFSQLVVGLLLMLIFISPCSFVNSLFKFTRLTY